MAVTQIPAEGCTPFVAYEDLSTYQFCFVKLYSTSNARVDYAGLLGTLGVGVLQNKPVAAGEPAAVFTKVGGICPVRAGDAFTIGQLLCSDADGEAVAAADGDVALAIAMDSAGAADDIVPVMIISPQYMADVSMYATGS
jgi:hypothetical protein